MPSEVSPIRKLLASTRLTSPPCTLRCGTCTTLVLNVCGEATEGYHHFNDPTTSGLHVPPYVLCAGVRLIHRT